MATFIDNLDGTDFITTDATKMSVALGVINHDSVADGTNDTVARDLSLPSALGVVLDDTAWRLRLQVNFTKLDNQLPFGNNNFYFIAISDSDQTANMGGTNNEGHIGIEFKNTINNDVDAVTWKATTSVNGGGAGGGPTFLTDLTVGTHFLEIERETLTLMRHTVYTDNTYTTVIDTKLQSVNAATTGLKFIKFGNFAFGGSARSFIEGADLSYEIRNGPPPPPPIQNELRVVERFDGDTLDDRWLASILRGTGNVLPVDAIDEGFNLLAQGPNPSDLKTKISFGGKRAFSPTGSVMIGIWRAVEPTDNASKMALINISSDVANSNFIQTSNSTSWSLLANDGATTSSTAGTAKPGAGLTFQRYKIELAPTVATLHGNGILEVSHTSNLPNLKLEPTFQVNSKVSGLARNMRVRYCEVYNT